MPPTSPHATDPDLCGSTACASFELRPIGEVAPQTQKADPNEAAPQHPMRDAEKVQGSEKHPQHRKPPSRQRQARNRKGCSEEVRARQRQRLETVARSCGLVLDPDPRVPGGEVLRPLPAAVLRRSCREQRSSTFRLVRGLPTGDQHPPLARAPNSAARLLRAAGLPQQTHAACSAGSARRPESAPAARRREGARENPDGNAQSLRPLPSQTSPSSPSVHELPKPEVDRILLGALANEIPVHVSRGTVESASEQLFQEADGLPPNHALQAAVLQAALQGRVPVRSISVVCSESCEALRNKQSALSTSACATTISAQSECLTSDDDLDSIFDGVLLPTEPSSEFEGMQLEP